MGGNGQNGRGPATRPLERPEHAEQPEKNKDGRPNEHSGRKVATWPKKVTTLADKRESPVLRTSTKWFEVLAGPSRNLGPHRVDP